MTKIYIGIALAFMVATASLGFMAKGNIDKLQSNLKGTKGDLQREQSNLQTAKVELKKATEDLGLANDKAKEATEALATKSTELSTKDQQLTAAQKEVETQTAEVTRLQKVIADRSKDPVAPDTISPQIAALTAQLQQAQADLAAATKAMETQADQSKANEAKLADLVAREKKREMTYGAAGLQGKVLAVNAGWNFVVLSVGDTQGVAVNAPLLVVRGNTPIARLRITSVESSKSIADVIAGSIARGLTVQPGDTVIFEGRTSATQLQKPTPESEPTGAAPRAT